MKQFLQQHSRGLILLLAGVGLLFIGAAGAFDLFGRSQSNKYLGEEVPREMIEGAYVSESNIKNETTAVEEGFIPFYVPAEATPEQLPLPTLESASAEELSGLSENPTPVDPVGLGELLDGETPGEATPEETEEGAVPVWIYIKKIALEKPIVAATSATVEVEENGETYEFVQWEAPDQEAVGWHTDSARLGVAGNTVLNGHHNSYGRVFRNLAYLQEGDYIQIYGDDGQWYTYVVANKMVLPEWNVTLEKRMENAAWILPSQDERLTLITCWPEQTNSHRLIIVARPVHW